MDVTIKNNTASAITNTKVTIISNNANVDLIQDDHAYYGTVAAGAIGDQPRGRPVHVPRRSGGGVLRSRRTRRSRASS